MWRLCKIDGSVLGGMQLRVLLGVRLEVLVCNPPPVFSIWGLRWLIFGVRGGGRRGIPVVGWQRTTTSSSFSGQGDMARDWVPNGSSGR